MNLFLTGATGFLGGELLVRLSKRKEIKKIFCLIRAKNNDDAYRRIDHIFNLHGDVYSKEMVFPIIADLSSPDFYNSLKSNSLLDEVTHILHSAANTSFSHIYNQQIDAVNIGGTEQILKWCSELKNLELFTYVGTATICGSNVKNRTVFEDESPNSDSTHFVRYTYSKMMGELLIQKYLPESKQLIVRPSIVMGDTHKWIPRSYVILWALQTVNILRLVPVNPLSKLDVISVDYATDAIVELLFAKRNYRVYHISAGEKSATTTIQVTSAINSYFPEKPSFQFIEKKFVNTIKRLAKTSIVEGSLNNYQEYLKYWSEYFDDPKKLRILFAGLDPYLEFIELGQIFDNSRLIQDTNLGHSTPAHEYVLNNLEYFESIDVFDGALNP
jgi:thioester reductase-like protein